MQGQDLQENANRPTLSIIVPMLNEEGNIQPFLAEISRVLTENKISYECLVVDDGSSDKTWALLQKASAENECVKGLRFSRNFGQQNAIFAGLEFASGRAVITMDGDLQHPPEVIPDLVKAWNSGYKIVQTRRKESQDTSFFKRQSSSLFLGFFSLLSDLPVASGITEFWLLDEIVVDVIKKIDDPEIFMRGLTHWVGFPTETIDFQVADRHTGETKFNLRSLLAYSMSSLVAFSLKPLKFGIWAGLLTSLFAFLEMIYIFTQVLRGESVPGWASTLTVISFMFGILFVLLGIIGTYIGQIFEVIRKRPRYIVSEVTGMQHDRS